MTKRFDSLMKRAAPLLAAGMLLQAGTCDVSGTAAGLANSIIQALVTNFVFGIFGLTP